MTTDVPPESSGRSKPQAEPRRRKRAAAAGAPQDSFRDRVHLRLLRAAERIITEEGLAEAQARRIAADAGCAIGTIYNVFGGLDGLIAAVSAETLRMFGRAATSAIQRTDPSDIEGRLLALALAYFEFAVTFNRRWRALFDHGPSAAAGNEEIRREQAALFVLVEEAVGSSLADPAERTRAARALFASTHGIVVLAVGSDVDPAQLAETEQQIRFVVKLFAKALTSATP